MFALLVVLILCYVFGAFEHLQEKYLSEFKTPLKEDIKKAILKLDSTKAIDQIADINNLNYRFIHDAKETCNPIDINIGNKNRLSIQPYLVILVKSKLTHFKRRTTIRKTWAQMDKLKLIRTVFLIGHTELENDDSEMNELKTESEKFNDIVQQNFIDNYYNNTLKTMMGIKWINRYCLNSEFYMFIDDDFYLNQNLLMHYLSDNVTDGMYKSFYAGYVFPNSSPMRHLFSKWYISVDEYPYHKFPPFIAAGCYILSQHTARLFYMGSKLIRLFRFDDIYMAILSYNIGISPIHLQSVNYYAPSYEPNLYANEVISAHDFKPNELVNIWNEIKGSIKFDSSVSYEKFLNRKADKIVK